MIHEVLLRLAEQAAAIHDAQRALHKLAELGIPLGDAGGAQESVEAMAGTGAPATVTDASGAAPERRDSTKRCKFPPCGKGFTPKRHGKKRDYCSTTCRTRAAVARQRERAAASDRATAAAICDQTVAEGYQPLKWGNGRYPEYMQKGSPTGGQSVRGRGSRGGAGGGDFRGRRVRLKKPGPKARRISVDDVVIGSLSSHWWVVHGFLVSGG